MNGVDNGKVQAGHQGHRRIISIFGERRHSDTVRLLAESSGTLLGKIELQAGAEELRALSTTIRNQIKDAIGPLVYPANAATEPQRVFERSMFRIGNTLAQRLLRKEDRKKLFQWASSVEVLALYGESIEDLPWEVIYDAPNLGFLCERVLIVRPGEGDNSIAASERRVVHMPAQMVVHRDAVQFGDAAAISNLEADRQLSMRIATGENDLVHFESEAGYGRVLILVTHGEHLETKAGVRFMGTVIFSDELALYSVTPRSFMFAAFCEYSAGNVPLAMVKHWETAVLACTTVLPSRDGMQLAIRIIDIIVKAHLASDEIHLVDIHRSFCMSARVLCTLFRLYGSWDLMIKRRQHDQVDASS